MNLNKKLDIWAKENLISHAQIKAISKFESRQKKPLLLYSLLFLSSFCIGLGIIAVIASNWQVIPPAAKLSVDFILLALLGGSAYYARVNNRPAVFETVLVLYAVMVLASIGLIAQIFQLPPQGMHALLFWSVIVSPLVLISRRIWISFFWLPVFSVSLLDMFYHFYWFQDAIVLLERSFPGAWQFMQLLLFVTIGRLLAASKAASHPLSSAFSLWSVLVLVLYVISFDFFGYHNILSAGDYTRYLGSVVELSGFAKLIVWLSLALLTGIFCFFNTQNNGKFWAIALFIVLNFILIAQFLPDDRTNIKILGALQSLSILGVGAAYAYKNNKIRLLNIITGLMALRFFIGYVQLFGTLLTTGLGLIVTGLIFLAMAYGWYKFKSSFADTAGRAE